MTTIVCPNCKEERKSYYLESVGKEKIEFVCMKCYLHNYKDEDS